MHVASFNAALVRGPIDDPVMAGPVARMDRVHPAADASPGFVWRLTDDSRHGVLGARREWLLALDGPPHVMWWLHGGGRPTFTFRDVFAPG